jgi:hypothetical protein
LSPLFDHNAASAFPVNLDILGEEDLHQHKVVLVFREKPKNFTACHQFTVGREDNTDAKVFGVTLNLYAVEVERRAGFAVHELVYGAACENGQYL